MPKVTPRISIIMSAYNEARHIGCAIESILAQSFSDWELIVIDDGSRDTTTEIVEGYAARDSRIRLIRNETNLGLPASLNRGIGAAKADLIARADADDINLPRRLEVQHEYMRDHPEVDVVGTGAYLLDIEGRRVTAVALPATHEELERLPFLGSHFFHPSVMTRKAFFEKAGLYDPGYLRTEDKELWLRGLARGCVYANIPEPLVEYSANGYARSWKSVIRETRELRRIAARYDDRFGAIGLLLWLAKAVAINLGLYVPRALRQGRKSIAS